MGWDLGCSKLRTTVAGPPRCFSRGAGLGGTAQRGGRVELMLEAFAFEAPTPPSTHGPTLGGKRGGVHALQGGPRGSRGWAKWENLPGSCPHRATLWNRGRAHSQALGIHRPGAVGTAVPWQRGKERTGISAATFPHVSLVRRVGVRADGQRPRGSCTPLSHP